MADQEDSPGLSKVIPSIYYDLIARATPGTAFLVVAGWSQRSSLGGMSWAKIVLLIGAGYLVGLVLTAFSLPWGLIRLVTLRFCGVEDWKKAFGWSPCDAIGAVSKEAGEILLKMRAEAVLSQNLVAGFAVLWMVNALSPFPLMSGVLAKIAMLVLLSICTIHRTAAQAIREVRFARIYLGELDFRPTWERLTRERERQSAPSSTVPACEHDNADVTIPESPPGTTS
jgi:hypothetical protein